MKQILRVISGAHAYGTAVEGSDVDYRGVYCAEPKSILTPFHPAGVIEGEGDDTSYELRHFFKLAVNANPNVLELLFVSESCIIEASPEGKILLENADLFLSKQIARTFIGFANSCVKRMQSGHTQTGDRKEIKDHGWDTKYAAHALRVLNTGMLVLKSGKYATKSDASDMLLAVRRGEYDYDTCIFHINNLKELVSKVEAASPLPNTPDISRLSKLCTDLTLSSWKLTC